MHKSQFGNAADIVVLHRAIGCRLCPRNLICKSCSHSVYSPKSRGAFWKRFKICTTLEPTTTTKKKKMRGLDTGNSSSCSAAFPIETFPLFTMFLSNFAFLFRMARGAGCHNCTDKSAESGKLR